MSNMSISDVSMIPVADQCGKIVGYYDEVNRKSVTIGRERAHEFKFSKQEPFAKNTAGNNWSAKTLAGALFSFGFGCGGGTPGMEDVEIDIVGEDGTAEGDDFIECEEGERLVRYSGPAGTQDVGICRPEIQECIGGTFVTTQAEILPQTEICNNLDDNCSGQTDEGLTQATYSGPAGTQDVGICRPEIQECIGGTFVTTQAEILPQTETCNNLDDNCNGQTDEGLTQTTYSGPAGTRNVGICQDQIEVCTDGSWHVTQREVRPQVENYMNRLDDDCDGYIDEIDLSGEGIHQYINECSLQSDFIRIQVGAQLLFNCINVEIETNLIEIDSASKLEIVPEACGYGDGNDGAGGSDGGGGGGGAHIGVGGSGGRGGWTGVGGGGGESYGSAGNFIVEPGSCGGDGGGPYGALGGFGGGTLTLIADTAEISGTIAVNGANGRNAPYDDGGGGGASGGAILIDTNILTVDPSSTRLSVKGGDGGNGGSGYAGGGGGGGGGSIEIMFDEAIIRSVATYYPDAFAQFIDTMNEFGCFDVAGGGGAWGVGGLGEPGLAGAVNTTMP